MGKFAFVFGRKLAQFDNKHLNIGNTSIIDKWSNGIFVCNMQYISIFIRIFDSNVHKEAML